MAAIDELQGADLRDEAAFVDRVVTPGAPVLIRGMTRDWPIAQAAATSPGAVLDYLAALDSGRLAEAFVGARTIAGRYHYDDALEGFNFTREPTRLADAVARIIATADDSDAPTIYVGSLPTDSYLPGFAEAHRLAVLPPGVRPRIWIGHASVVACHHDNVDNLACVAAGRRRFTLYPPDAIGDLYVGPIDHTLAGQPISLATGAAPDDPRFPRFGAAQARALVAELAPGDAIYIPKLWWHQVEATGAFNILVNHWWDSAARGPDSPYTAMLLAMATIADRPDAERAAWRAYFDHYVFRPDGHPLAHLPAERHGILGTGQHGRLRAMVMRLLRGG